MSFLVSFYKAIREDYLNSGASRVAREHHRGWCGLARVIGFSGPHLELGSNFACVCFVFF